MENLDAGFAIKPDGELANLHNGSSVKGLGRPLMRAAIDRGATKLDHFDKPYLSKLYEWAGFKEVGRVKFDLRQAPKGWNTEVDGTPDIIFRELQEPAALRKSVEDEDPLAGVPEDVDIDELMSISICACRWQVEAGGGHDACVRRAREARERGSEQDT